MPTRKPTSYSARRAAAILALSLAIGSASAGPVFAPGRRLYTIRTEHFDIIFPERSRPTAISLASFAEEVLAYVEGELSLSLPERVPVVITPDIGTFNGYSSPFPYTHIVLFDTPLDPDWTVFEDNLRGLFVHELTHAVSLQSRAGWADFLSGVFGSWMSPALANAPEFMVEGVTVGLEGEGGAGGRAADPLVRERIRQDIRENRFKSPLECTGVYDAYPGGTVYYEYGGLFTDYLRGRYGSEPYARLWKSLGSLILSCSIDPYRTGFYAAFRKAYGLGFEEAWADFRDAMALPGIEDAPEMIGPARPQYVDGLAAGGGALFWVDGFDMRALRLDVSTGRASVLFAADSSCEIADASEDGSRLLVYRSVALPDGRDRVETALYDVAARRFVPGAAEPGLREARFFRDGLVGIAPNLHDGDLVLVRGGERRVLLPGSAGAKFASPAVLDEDRIALIVILGARRSLGVLDVDSGLLELIRPEGEGSGLLDHVRQISASGGRLWFNHDSDDRFYKLGVVEGLSGGDRVIRVEGVDRSGGVFSPVELGDRVYFVGRFSEGSRICVAPGSVPGAAVGGEGARAGGDIEIPYRLERFDPVAVRDERDGRIAEASEAASVEPYRPLSYLNPLGFWIPYVDPSTLGRSLRPFAFLYMGDPTDENVLLANLGYDSAYPFADLALEWANYRLPVVVDLALADRLSYGLSGPPARLSSATLSTTLELPFFPGRRALSLGLGGEAFARARGSEGSPYEWPYDGRGAVASALVGWNGRIVGPWRSSGRGLDLASYHDLSLESLVYKAEGNLVASWDRPALRLDLWAAWASEPIMGLDASSEVFSSDRRPPYAEYASSGLEEADALALGMASWRLADQPIRSGVLGLYLNRLILDVGYRAAAIDGRFPQSCFARASLDASTALGAAGGVGLRFFAEAFVRLDGSAPEDAVGWRYGATMRGDVAPSLRPSASREGSW